MKQLMDHKKEFCKVVERMAGKYGRHEIFTDFCELAALSLRQPFKRSEKNERAYLDLITGMNRANSRGSRNCWR